MVGDCFPPLVEEVGDCLSPLGEEVGDCLSPLVEGLGDCLSPLVEEVADCFSPLVEEVADCLSPLVEEVADCLSPLVEEVADCLSPLVEEVAQRPSRDQGAHPQTGDGAVAEGAVSAEHSSMPRTYILECADGSYYVGSTTDLDRRVYEHNEGLGAAYTRRRRPVTLVWSAYFDRVADAFAFEKQVQNWGRAKREALIDGRTGDLGELASRSWAARRARGVLRAEECPPGGPSVS